VDGAAQRRHPLTTAVGGLPSPVVEDVDPWTAIGVIAAAVGIVASIGSAMRWVRARWQRTRTLRKRLDQVEHENATLARTATAISQVMLDGITWKGWRIPPPELEAPLDILRETDRALERLHARVRAMRAEEAVERLRADIERAIAALRRGVDLYRQGTWATYREAAPEEGAPPRRFGATDPATGRRRYLPAASGDDPLPALHAEEAVEEARRRSRDVDLFVRSAWHQIGDDARADAFSAAWPTREYEVLGPP
jgi:hypothetical protein